MSSTITLTGGVKFSFKKLVAGGEMAHSTYTGPGELLLAPPALGDITILSLNGNEFWKVGKDAFLACTQGVIKDYKSQGFGKAMFSGEGLFIYHMSGTGLLWITSLGAIIRKDVSISSRYVAFVRLIIHSSASTWRKICCRQRPSRCVELRVRPRACVERRTDLQLDRRRRLGLSVHRPWHGLLADKKSTGFRTVARDPFSCQAYVGNRVTSKARNSRRSLQKSGDLVSWECFFDQRCQLKHG